MPPVQCIPGHHNVALGAPWVGEVSLLQNYDGILEMPVEEMDPHRRLHRQPSRTLLNGAVPWSSGGWEGHTVGTWIPTGGCGLPTPSPTCFLPMMRLHVACQRPKRHLLPKIRALYPIPLPLKVGRTCSFHPSPVRRLQLRSLQLEWAEDHSDCLTDIDLHAHPSNSPTKVLKPPWSHLGSNDATMPSSA